MSERARRSQRAGVWSVVTAIAVGLLLTDATGLAAHSHSSGAARAGVSTVLRLSGPLTPPSLGRFSDVAGSPASQCGFYGSPYGPSGAVYDYGTGQVFVADSLTNEVYVISETSNTIVKVISLGQACVNPFGLAYDPALGEVFVAETGAGAIAVISDENDSVEATFPVAGGPWNIAYDSGQDQLFVTDLIQGNISVLSLPSGTPVRTISEGRVEQPLGLAYIQAKGEVFVANSLGNYSDTLTLISDVSDSVTASVPVGCAERPGTFGEDPFGVVSDPATGHVCTRRARPGTD